jgi:hypothetical protein
MADGISDILSSYNDSVDAEEMRLVRHQLEYDLTLRYFAANLDEQCSR